MDHTYVQTVRVSIIMSVRTLPSVRYDIFLELHKQKSCDRLVASSVHAPKAKNGDHEFAYQKYIPNSL